MAFLLMTSGLYANERDANTNADLNRQNYLTMQVLRMYLMNEVNYDNGIDSPKIMNMGEVMNAYYVGQQNYDFTRESMAIDELKINAEDFFERYDNVKIIIKLANGIDDEGLGDEIILLDKGKTRVRGAYVEVPSQSMSGKNIFVELMVEDTDKFELEE